MSSKTFNSSLPSIALEGSLANYLTQIKKFPMLSSEEEYMLAKSWKDKRRFKICTKISNKSFKISCKNCNGLQRLWITRK